MLKTISAISAAAALAGSLFLVPVLTPSVEAHVPEAGAKSDRLDFKSYGSECSEHAWPYFEAQCLRNAVSPIRTVKAVRIISADHLN